ncbi:hypothetical protein [Glycomyces arizonensis]|uniref:hypothetical protein n=1 Tax=Glycomyces arizonensis TaxID=256035 RepID=UPI0003F56740|nr:hypothetical protein [Glycomyces arizonensis]
MDDRVVIGRFETRTRPHPIRIEAEAEPESESGTVWLTRTGPGPRRLLGYVPGAHGPGAHFQSYTTDLPEATAEELREGAAGLWSEALARGRVRLRRAAGPVLLGLEVLEGLRVDFVWDRLGAVELEFRDLEPEHLGTATGLDGSDHRFLPTPPHTAWATEPGRPERLIAAAADAYRRRPEPH